MRTRVTRVVLPVMLTLTSAAPASGQPTEPSDFALTVSPTRVIVPADQIERPREFTVTNHGRAPIDILVRKASFTAGRDGELRFRPDAPHSAVEWVTARPDSFRLDGGAARQVSLRIALPAAAEPGEHQVAVIFSVPPRPGGASIGVRRSVGAPVYVTVPGHAVESVDVTSLRAPGFAVRGPLAVTATVRNLGTVRRDFLGDGRLRARVAGDSVPFPDFTLLRGADREVSARWADPPLACVCRVTVAVVGSDGVTRDATATIVVLPLHLIGSGAALVVALLLGWLLVRRRRRSRPFPC
ncbi:hypothetical protein I0C86_22385 [Plantactinospora sp. S1510]|uniref:DUF916 domain-containing protein n=1 Tax=Plantactinospora alkalitolerans TaxID=2789879 RepID=A0ABS0GZR3_9ACTN|nr:hypothetical protein [Plantactinospora alkalitolerans]MBF9131692.1 hypothetical protein [Plantactinospora alkalitolerans]